MKSLQAELSRLFGEFDPKTAAALLSPAPLCDICQDMGVIRYEVPLGDPRFGKLFPCPNPECPARMRQAIERVERFKAAAEWEADYAEWTFDTFIQVVQARFEAVTLSPEARKRGAFDGKRAAFAAARYWAEHVGQMFSLGEATQQVWNARHPGANADRMSNSVVLRGDVGLGKTGLAVAAANLMRENGHAVVFTRVQSIIRRIQDTYSDASTESLDDVLNFYASAPVLVIDEFGLERYADDRLEKLEEIIRGRDRKSLPFLLTTNLTLDEIYRLWRPRIADVVAKAHSVPIGGVKLRDTAAREEVIW